MTPDGDRQGEPRPTRVLPPGSVTIRCRRDGPLVVELAPDVAAQGTVLRVTDHEGGEYPLPAGDRPLALCRCGTTATKPFCDGSHRRHGFEASDTAPAAEPPRS